MEKNGQGGAMPHKIGKWFLVDTSQFEQSVRDTYRMEFHVDRGHLSEYDEISFLFCQA